ncbi:hypothetical protein AK830_g10943 [Neonectria ditissima]|uniref:Wax synthase domain-containing protein n=1 Tax=Neonectria ditissima TaxID=78410 RepID=A0A0P7B4K5_9HYPO|nr:hypothetical protein AK830_g10943 [Neonectria ditissima]
MAASVLPNPGDLARLDYRDAFARAVAEHRIRPLVVPYCLIGTSLLPPLWLAFSHTGRPWVYRSRWLVVGLVVIMDAEIIGFMSSANVASAYAAGLMGMWGIISALHLLVWSCPQSDAARAIKVVKRDRPNGFSGMNGSSKADSQIANKLGGGRADDDDGLRLRRLDGIAASGSDVVSQTSQTHHRHDLPTIQHSDSDLDHDDDPGNDCVWQPFPEHGSFLQRLNWSLDFVTNYRCIGWNCSIRSVPLPQIPARIGPGDPVSLNAMPVVSRSGYRRNLTTSEFIWTRLRTLAVLYVILDFLAVFMMKDPYFVLGPDRSIGHELPPLLRQLPSWALLTYRELFSVAGVFSAISEIFIIHDFIQYYVFSHIFPIRKDLWQYTSIFGSFSQALDRGLAGWWGSWWHQTFRLQFSSPAAYLINNGYLTKGTVTAQIVTLYVSFLQSGLLHASGSLSSMPQTKLWRAPLFFFLQPPGILIQAASNWIIDTYLPHTPKMLRRVLNLGFALAWLQITARFFCDDIASTGLWLLEPVPVSPFRFLGFGHPNDHWWRLNRELFPKWHSGDHWWTSGLQI